MGWILLQMALLLSLRITTAFAEQEKTKDISKTGHRSLESFLKNVLDSSEELTKIRNEVRANEELGDAVPQYPANQENSQPRQKRKVKAIPEAKVSGKTAKDPHMLRRVLNLYMKRAQMFRHGKGQNLHEDSQQKFSESSRGKREFHSTHVVIPSENLQKNSDNFSQRCSHKYSNCERKQMRSRRWGDKNGNYGGNEAQNGNNKKFNSVVENKIDIVNRKAATSETQSKYPLSNMAQKGTSDVQTIASYKQSGTSGSSANSPPSVVPGSSYDLDCVHEIPSLETSLVSRNVKGTSSLAENFSNENDLKHTNNMALNGQETPIDSKFTKYDLVSQAETLNDQPQLNEVANKQEKIVDAPEQISFSSDGVSSGKTLDIVNPIVLDVLEKVSKVSNETIDNNADTEGGKSLVNAESIRLSKGEIQAKTSSIENLSRQKSTSINNKYENLTKGSADKNKLATHDALFQKSHENDLMKKQPSRSKTFQTSPENHLKDGQSIRTKTFQMSHENDLAKSVSNSDQSGHKQERFPISNIKGKSSQIQKSKLPESLSAHKTPYSINDPIYNPAAPITNSAQKGLTHSGKQKLEKVIAPVSLHTKNHASLPKNKLDSDIILRTELLHKSDKATINPGKSKNKVKNAEVSLKKKTNNIKQKRNAIKETSTIQKNTEDFELKDDIHTRNTRQINDNTPNHRNILGSSENVLGENENIKSSNVDGISLTSQSHDLVDTEEANQGKHTGNKHVNKRSLKLDEEKKHKELMMTGDVQNVAKENEESVGHQSKFSESLRRKRHASRFKKHLEKRKRQYWQGDSKSSSEDKHTLKDYNVLPYKSMKKHADSENKEESTHQKMLRQVEDMILALKQENHKYGLNHGSEFSQRVGRKLHSITAESRDNSDSSSDNDDYYYYDEADVDKRRPEHSKVSQKLNRKETLDKLEPKSMRKKQMYVQKQFSGTEYLNNQNPVNIDYSYNNDPSLNAIQNEQVLSDLITSESNKISHFNKEMPEEVFEAHYNRSIQDERERIYEENVIENNNAQSSLSRDEINQNSRVDKKNPNRALRKTIIGNKPITRLNEGQLEQLNKELNEIVLNQTAVSWDDIGQDETGYNAHMRYKRADNVYEMGPSLKSGNELRIKQQVAEDKNKINKLALTNSTNVEKDRKQNTFLANSNLSKTFNSKEDKNYKITVTGILPIKNSSSFIVNKLNILNDTVLNCTKDGYNSHNIQNKLRCAVTEHNWTKGEHNKNSTTKRAVQIPLLTNNGDTHIIINDQNEEVNVSDLSNLTSTTRHSLQSLQNLLLSNDVNSKDNYNEHIFPKDTINLENVFVHHKGESKEYHNLQEFNSPKYSYDKEKIEHKINKNSVEKEKMLNNGIPGKGSTTKEAEHHKHSKHLLEIADAKGNISHYEPLTIEKQQSVEMLQDRLLSPDIITKVKEMSLESSKALLRNKRNGEENIRQTFEELPDYSDYSIESETDSYTYDNPSTSGDAIILHIVLDTTESTNQSVYSGSINTISGTTAADNSMYVTSPITLDTTEARESLPTPEKPDQGDSDKQTAENISSEYKPFNMSKYYNDTSLPASPKPDQGDNKMLNAEKISAEYQSFNTPKYYNDNSQLNNTINGALASKIVDLVFEAVNASQNLKRHLGGTLKKIDYGSQEQQPSYETGISQEMLEKEEEQYHQKTGSLLSKVMELLDVLVEEEVNKRSCISLQPELHEFLLWMLELPEPGKLVPSEFNVPNNFLFMQKNKRPRDKTKENESVKIPVSHQNMNVKELNQQIELLNDLIAEYLQLPDSEKVKVNYVYAFLTEQLEALERIRRSDIVAFRSKADDDSFSGRLSKIRLQDAKGADANLKNAKIIQRKLGYNSNQHNVPNELLSKDRKRTISPKEDGRYSKMALEQEKSLKYPSYVSEDYRISNRKPLKVSSGQHSAHKWSKDRQHLIKNLASGSLDTSDIHNPVHLHNSNRHYQRKRRYGGHGHGASKNKHHNVTHLHVPTMRYRQLLKRAAEFRERRGSFI